MAAPGSVDEYLAALPEDRRAVLEQMRRTIRAAAPDATETIAYGMPAFTNHGRFLVSFAAYKDHFSLFPASGAVKEALGPDLAPYVSGRGTIRFPAGGRVPAELVTRVVSVRLAEAAPRTAR